MRCTISQRYGYHSALPTRAWSFFMSLLLPFDEKDRGDAISRSGHLPCADTANIQSKTRQWSVLNRKSRASYW